MSPAANSRPTGGRAMRAWLALAAAAALCLALAAPAMARPAWRLDSLSDTTVAQNGTLEYVVQLTNVGDADTDGSPIELAISLPDGLVADTAELFDISSFTRVPCTAGDGVSPVAGARDVLCRSSAIVPWIGSATSNFQRVTMTAVAAPDAAGTLTTELELSGGGADNPVATADPVLVSNEPPDFGVDAFDGQVVADPAGTPFTQAGGHPYAASVSIDFNTLTSPQPLEGSLWPVEPVKNVLVDLPPGLVGNPTAADRCTAGQLSGPGSLTNQTLCPASSQVGTALVRARGSNTSTSAIGPLPVYNMVPPPDVPARFGFNVLGSVIVLDGELRSGGDYGLSVNAKKIPEALGIAGTTVTFWGDPSSSDHDDERACPLENPPSEGGRPCENGGPPKAFLRNPTMCTDPGVGLPVTARIDSWDDPGDFKESTWISHEPPAYPYPPALWGPQIGTTDCDDVPFTPELDAQPNSRAAGKPSAFTFDLSMPQTDDPAVVGHADLKKAVVTLPLGVRVSPSSADGLAACSPAQIGLDDGNAPTCPEASKIGSVTIDTPLLPDPLRGAVYLARQNDNPFGSLLALYLAAEGPGVVVKLPGKVDAHPISGQLTAEFDDNPQLPFSNLHLEFKGGPRAPLVLPELCGTYTTNATMTGWNGATVVDESSFTVDEGCGMQFAPAFDAGTTNPVAGGSSTFTLRIARDDADQEIAGLSLDMPRGLTGRIADVVLCAGGDAAAGTCPEASRVGDVTVGAGAGTNPFYITNGRVYLTEGYKGAPFGLSVVVPAVAGPFDLGVVSVRQALFVDRHTAEIRVVSDPLPTILEGIPLDVRDIRVTINRDGFFLNPTSCEEKTIGGRIDSTLGSSVNVSTRFQVGECAALELEPKMRLVVGGRNRTQRGRSTPLRATLRQTPGQSALDKVRVTLPTALNARLTVINDACTREQYDSGSDECEFARTGDAVAITPLLRDPLRGGVYFVENGNPLPDLFVRLRGQVDFDLIGKITIPGSKRLRTTFALVPDVPISMFSLRLESGRDGSVGNAANLCSRRGRTARAALAFVGQNGKRLFERKRLKVRGCKAKRAAGKRARRRGRR